MKIAEKVRHEILEKIYRKIEFVKDCCKGKEASYRYYELANLRDELLEDIRLTDEDAKLGERSNVGELEGSTPSSVDIHSSDDLCTCGHRRGFHLEGREPYCVDENLIGCECKEFRVLNKKGKKDE